MVCRDMPHAISAGDEEVLASIDNKFVDGKPVISYHRNQFEVGRNCVPPIQQPQVTPCGHCEGSSSPRLPIDK